MASQFDETRPHPAEESAFRDGPQTPASPGRAAGQTGWTEVPVYESRSLFGQRKEVGIVHEGALYRLKITRQGKLVLNK